MSVASLFKQLLRKPIEAAGGDVRPREDGTVSPNQIVARPGAESLRLPMVDDGTAPPTPAAAAIAPEMKSLLRKPVEAVDETQSPLSDSSLLTPQPLIGLPVKPVAPIAGTVPTATVAAPAVRVRRPSEATLEEINRLENNKAVNEDTGFKSKAWDVIKNSAKNFLGTYAATGELGAAVGGAIGGAGAQIFDPTLDEKLKRQKQIGELYGTYGRQTQTEIGQEKIVAAELDREKTVAEIENLNQKPIIEREKLRARIESDTQKHKNRMELVNRQADIRSGEAKVYTDEEGKQWKQFLKPGADGRIREMEPIMNPLTGEQDFEPGEQTIPWKDPLTGEMIQVKAKQVLMPGAQLATGNANREQQAATTNANNQMEVEQKNVANQLTYQNQANTVLSAILSNDANLAQYGGRVEGINAEIGNKAAEGAQLLAELETINAKDYSNASDAEIKQANDQRKDVNERYNKLFDEYSKLQGNLQEELGKTEAGKIKAGQLSKLMPKAPARLTFAPIKAAKVTGGISSDGGQYRGQSFQLNDALRSRFNGKSDAEIKQIIEAQGGQLR